MRLALRVTGALALMGAAACAAMASLPPIPAAGPDRPIRIEARHIPLGLGGAALAPGVTYAGGLSLYGPDLHGLSDLKLDGDRAWAVSDFGALVRFTLRMDERGRLTGAGEAVTRALTGPDGAILSTKTYADAESLALLPDGRVLVGFEGDHRIWSYGADAASAPVRVRAPDHPFARNQGIEALAPAPDGRWLAMGETGGAWLCDDDVCEPLPNAPAAYADGFLTTGADVDPEGGWFIVQRFYAPPLNLQARVLRMAPDGTLSAPLIQLRPPASVDNFEGIAAVRTATGARLYLLSDDNAIVLQRTLLMAFDVRG
jgi:hypothetical protein